MKASNPNINAIKLIKQANKLESQAQILYGKATHFRIEAELVCIHNETEPKYEYEPGGYYDREVYINKVICKVCGKVLEEERKLGGYG